MVKRNFLLKGMKTVDVEVNGERKKTLCSIWHFYLQGLWKHCTVLFCYLQLKFQVLLLN